MTLPEELETALAGVRSVGVITGAGISAESGVPTYRGTGGLYDDPEEGDRTIEALSGPTLQRDPDRTWRAIAALARKVEDAKPNDAHHALVAIESKVEEFVLLTQNVDGLHQVAGSQNVIDIHGTASDTLCMACGARDTIDDMGGIEATPLCAACGGKLRPDVVLFGELLPTAKVSRMASAFQSRSPDLVLAIGTSALFPYIVEPVWVAAQRGCLTVEVNPEPTVLSTFVDHALRGPAGRFLPLIASCLPAGASQS